MAKAREFTLPPGRLWPNTPSGNPLEVEIFGSTGEFQSGKTILGLSIAPGKQPAGHAFAGKGRTLYLDLEKSGATYGGTGCDRIDVPAEMVKLYGTKYSQRQQAEWFNSLPSRLNPGQYDVILVDPVNDIESGEVDIVKADPGQYGYTKGQVESSVGLLMAAMKAHWKKVLMTFSTVCKCFYFTTHLRDEFRGGKPSGRREPRGKETLAELASLYLWLERLPNDKGEVSDEPSAIVLKQRLADTTIDAQGNLVVVALMPPRIPVATVGAVRGYIANPPDYKKLAAGERVIEKQASEEELLRIKLATAEAERETVVNRITLEANRKSFAQVQAERAAAATQPSDQSAATNAAAQEKRTADAEQAEIERLNAKASEELAVADARAKELAATKPAESQPAAVVAPVAIAAPAVPVSQPNAERFKDCIIKLGYQTDPVFQGNVKRGLEFCKVAKFSDLNGGDQTKMLGWLTVLVECQALAAELGYTDDKLGPWLKSKTGVERIAHLEESAARSLLSAFQNKKAAAKNP